MMRTASVVLGSVLALACVSGCVVRSPASTHRLEIVDIPARLEASDWPRRSVAIDPILFASVSQPGAVVSLGPYGEGFLYEFGLPTVGTSEDVEGAPETLMLDLDDPETTTLIGNALGATWDLTHNLLFVSSPVDVPAFRTGGARVTYWPDGRRSESVVVEGLENATFIGIRTPDAYPNRGLVVYLSSILGISDAEAKLIRAMRRAGWAVIVVTPSADIYSETVFIVPDEGDANDGRDDDRDDRDPVEVADRTMMDGVEIAAQRIAQTMDNHLAERVYAVESALTFLDTHLPEIRREPLVLVGGSAGALNLPALAARLGDEVDAAVIIGGGADFFDIIRRSPLAQGRLKIRWPDGSGTSADRDRLAQLVRSYSRLDPYHTAPFLVRTPVLLLHATFDAIIPASTGDLLYERLGEPERWKFRTGHYGLFFLLPGQSRQILRWMEEATTSS